jgi:hypothetical protein
VFMLSIVRHLDYVRKVGMNRENMRRRGKGRNEKREM